jgi:hypothetical protein
MTAALSSYWRKRPPKELSTPLERTIFRRGDSFNLAGSAPPHRPRRLAKTSARWCRLSSTKRASRCAAPCTSRCAGVKGSTSAPNGCVLLVAHTPPASRASRIPGSAPRERMCSCLCGDAAPGLYPSDPLANPAKRISENAASLVGTARILCGSLLGQKLQN